MIHLGRSTPCCLHFFPREFLYFKGETNNNLTLMHILFKRNIKCYSPEQVEFPSIRIAGFTFLTV